MDALLVSSSALDNLWGEAFLIACFLQNRIPHRKTEKKKHLMSYGKVTNQTWNTWVWGCLAKVMLPDPKKKENKT